MLSVEWRQLESSLLHGFLLCVQNNKAQQRQERNSPEYSFFYWGIDLNDCNMITSGRYSDPQKDQANKDTCLTVVQFSLITLITLSSPSPTCIQNTSLWYSKELLWTSVTTRNIWKRKQHSIRLNIAMACLLKIQVLNPSDESPGKIKTYVSHVRPLHNYSDKESTL